MTTAAADPADLLAEADMLRGKPGELTALHKLAEACRPRLETGTPDPGTPERALWSAAIDIAADTPLRPGTYVTHARIPWSDMTRLRRAMEAVGIDWRVVKADEEARHGRPDSAEPERARGA